MTIIYQSFFTHIEESAKEALSDGLFITFSEEKITADMMEYCFVHQHGTANTPFQLGDVVVLGEKRFSITAIGEVAWKNFAELGHITLFFDGAETAKLSGAVHLLGEAPKDLRIGSAFLIERY